MKCIKKVIMGIASVMVVLAIGAVSISAQELTPVKADTVQTKASESITIEMNIESDKYEIAAENNTPVKDENAKNDKASEGITIDTNSESQEYSVYMIGSAEYNECPITLCEDAEIVDVTDADGNVIIKSSTDNDKLLISRDGGKTWVVSEMPEIAETAQ